MLKLRGVNKPLINNLVRRQAGYIEVIPLVQTGLGNGILELPANDIQLQLEVEVALHIRPTPDEELPDSGHDRGC